MNKKLKNLPQAERVQELLTKITSDRSRGSRELGAKLIEELLGWGLEIERLTETELKTLCRVIAELRPEMAVVVNTGYLLWDKFQRRKSDDPHKALTVGLRELRTAQEEAGNKIIEHSNASELNDRDVMTFSRSSTVLKLLLNEPAVQKAVVLHSSPGEEGIDLAEDLAKNVEVTFAYDVEAGYFLPRVDALYLGVDTIFEDGSIVNKTGSRLLARSSTETTPVRAVTDIWKLSPEEAITEVPRYPSPNSLPEELQREHPLFETVPAELIDSYITNRGIFNSTEQLRDNLADLREAHKKLNG